MMLEVLGKQIIKLFTSAWEEIKRKVRAFSRIVECARQAIREKEKKEKLVQSWATPLNTCIQSQVISRKPREHHIRNAI